MTAVTIALRELRERSRLFVICAALAVIPFLAAAMPGARSDRAGVIAVGSSLLALTLSLGSAVALGGSTVARDLVERRLSFYFAKPIPAAAIWIGKAAASILASYACFAIIAGPAMLVAGDAWPNLWTMTSEQLLATVGGGVVVLFFVTHVLASMIRSRSPLIAVDFLLAVLFAGGVALLARPLLIGAAFELLGALISLVIAAVLLVAALAPIGQLARGRTDVRRSHAALSRSLWPPLFALLALIGIYDLWVVSVTPADLSSVLYIEQPARGERAFVFGTAGGRGDYHASFVIDGNGEGKRLRAAPWSPAAFSRDGRVMAWLEPVGLVPRNAFELRTDAGPTGIRTNGFAEVVLSDDGSRAAVGQGKLVTVYELASGNLLASAGGFDPARKHAMFFPSNDVLRVIEHEYRGAGELRIFELDIPRKKLAVTGTTRVTGGDTVIASSDGSRLLLRKTRRVLDGRTAATLADLPPSAVPAGAVLRDGRVVEIEGGRLRVIGGREVALPVSTVSVAGELANGTLLVAGSKERGWSATGTDRSLFVVDLDRGAIVSAKPSFKGPQSRWWAADPRLLRFEGTRFVGVDAGGNVVWWDATTPRPAGAG